MREGLNRRIQATVIIASIFLLDRMTKDWALDVLQVRGEIPVFPFFSLTYVENTGVAFGMFRDNNSPLIFLSIALVIGLLVWRRKVPPAQRWTHWAILLVIGGAVGNLYDRIAYGFVVDFFDFKVWPVFNVADSCITIGACLLALEIGKQKDDAGPAKT